MMTTTITDCIHSLAKCTALTVYTLNLLAAHTTLIAFEDGLMSLSSTNMPLSSPSSSPL